MASCQEDYFSTLIRLRLFSPVNPKTDPKRFDRITIGAKLWLDDDGCAAIAAQVMAATGD